MRTDLPWTSSRIVVADVEGNGRRPPSLVEAALVPIVDGRIGEPATWLVRPAEPITWQATRVHGISNQEVADLPDADGGPLPLGDLTGAPATGPQPDQLF